MVVRCMPLRWHNSSASLLVTTMAVGLYAARMACLSASTLIFDDEKMAFRQHAIIFQHTHVGPRLVRLPGQCRTRRNDVLCRGCHHCHSPGAPSGVCAGCISCMQLIILNFISKLEKKLLSLIQDVGEGWWEGELHGQAGLFPETYVEVCLCGVDKCLKCIQIIHSILFVQFSSSASAMHQLTKQIV